MTVSFALLDVPVTLRPTALGAGLLSGLIVAGVTRERRAALALGASALWYTADCAHVVGHILSSRAVGAPMDAVDFGLYPKSVYHDHAVAPEQHIGRAVGGVGASLLAALIVGALARLIDGPLARPLLRISAAQHGLLFAISMLPLPIVDGGVIYANLARLRGERR